MSFTDRLLHRFDVRPDEVRTLLLLLSGAFLVVSYMVVARALREAVYLTTFDVTTLPYITGAAALLSLPAVAWFSKVLSRVHPCRAMYAVAGISAIGLLLLLWIGRDTAWGVVALYLWTALSALLVTSGFWIVAAEFFTVRAARRLYGIIGAGGTVGALIVGVSLSWYTRQLDVLYVVPLLVALLLLYVLLQSLLPGSKEAASATTTTTIQRPMKENFSLVYNTPHLRTIAWIVFLATMASTLVDYQFKEIVSARYTDQASLTSFFGAFYGWTGGVALLIQLLLAARLMAVAGIAASLTVLPIFLLLGAGGLLIAPGIVLAVLVRGGDNSLRKSIHRQLLEFLYVPLPAALRRRTKTFVDSVVDSLGEGAGSLVIFLWVTLPGLPSRYLALFVMILSGLFILVSQRMGREYFSTIVARLQDEEAEAAERSSRAMVKNRHLLSASFSRMDIEALLTSTGLPELAELADLRKQRRSGGPSDGQAVGSAAGQAEGQAEGTRGERAPAELSLEQQILQALHSPEDSEVLRALSLLREKEEVSPEDIEAVIRLLARDKLYNQVVAGLQEIGEPAVPLLAAALCCPETDFVIRRRIPAVLASTGGPEADDALIDALRAERFEVRYRCAVALVRRRKLGLPVSRRAWRPLVWKAIAAEVHRDRPIWELQRLLDGQEADDELVVQRVDTRGLTSLEHTFRMLTLVLDPEPVRAAFHGVILDEERLRTYALEYLEHALPAEIREKLWTFIGDISERQRARDMRPLDHVVSDLVSTRATLFAGEKERDALKRMLADENRKG